MKNKIFGLVFAILFLLSAETAFSGVIINEIMYDAAGSDTGAEWIEIYNSGSSVDLSGWKFYEADTNHGLTLVSGSMTLESGDYALIVLDPNIFSATYNTSASIFDSSFSLINSGGEYLAIKDASGNVIDDVNYNPEDGGGDDGNSLSLLGGSWQGATPTPGSANSTQTILNSDTDDSGTNSSDDDSDDVETHTTSSDGTSSVKDGDTKKETVWSIDVVAPSYGVAGNEIVFSTEVYNDNNKRVYPGYLVWNMGDGSVIYQEKSEDLNYTYNNAGTYVIFVEYYRVGSIDGEPEVTARIELSVVEGSVLIESTKVNGTYTDVTLSNDSSKEINLGGWKIVSSSNEYVFPKNTIILGGKALTISGKYTKFGSGEKSFSLYDPSLNLVASYPKEEDSEPKRQTYSYKGTTSSTDSSSLGEVLGASSEAGDEKSDKKPMIILLVSFAVILIATGGAMYFFGKERAGSGLAHSANSDIDKYTFI